ncbi:hypothetical protein COLO4_37766 [Corchorus olitorius]|uniref:Uncharacterized protein n=1 Tax=Corchorus olitorius TaxID=93759 RepID=A0A1R3FZE8_9ROSI|nr:hypothetical protein COLO4_37766 [Corchorus olitorius]
MLEECVKQGGCCESVVVKDKIRRLRWQNELAREM